jgi:hypothetical protein
MIFMMNRQFSQIGMRKFTRATAAYPGIELKRLAAIRLLSELLIASSVGNYPVKFVFIGLYLF